MTSLLDRVVTDVRQGQSVDSVAQRHRITTGLVETMIDHANRAGLLTALDLAACRSDSGPGCTPGSTPGCAGCPLMPVESLRSRLRRISKR